MPSELLLYGAKRLPFDYLPQKVDNKRSYVNTLTDVLSSDLDFKNQSSSYSSHNFHSFPAKFPPQLPAKFILALTRPGEVVLDPMVGSGTTILEAYFAARKGIGFDIDPLALMISKVKTTHLEVEKLVQYYQRIIKNAREHIKSEKSNLKQTLANRWDSKTKEFVDYWFTDETQLELLALALQISELKDEPKNIFRVSFFGNYHYKIWRGISSS